MNTIETIQSRVKYSRMFTGEKNGVKRLYIPYGKNGSGIKTSAWFEVVNDHLQVFCKVENDRHPNLFDDQLADRYKAEIEKQFHELINNCELERKKVPLHERLKDDVIPVYDDVSLKHQANALRFCCSMKVTALFADTGTGKSKIAIDTAISRFEARQIKKVLVFLPVSTKKNFRDQIALWCNCPTLEWKLIGHESMGSSDKAVFEALDYADNETQIIIDESHMIKGPIAKRSKRIKMVCEKSSYKIVMTGTPVSDNVHNLYMQYAVLSDLIIGVRNWLKFEEKYLIMGGRNGDEIIGYKNVDHLMGLLEPYTYQIAKEDCINLPAKNFLSHTCDLNEAQQERYNNEKDYLLEIIKRDEFRATDIFQVFTRMQQITCGYYRSRHGEVVMLGNPKLELLSTFRESEQTIFFCKYIIEVEMLILHFGHEKCALFTGQNPKERDAELDRFVSGEKQYFVATMQSGGTGLNGLQIASSRIVFFSNSFSYLHRKQSIGRIDRQGQLREMYIHDLITCSGIDNRIMGNLHRKGNLADEIKELMLDKTKLKQYVETL